MAAGSGLLLVAGCTTTTVLAPAETGAVTDSSDAALPLVNAVRNKHRRSDLSVDPTAVAAAKDQAVRMSRYGKMSHFLGDDPGFLGRMKRLDVALPAAENIASGQVTLEGAILAWVHSPKHLENMLGNYKGLGVAVARNAETGNRTYWAMVLSNSAPAFFRI